MTNPISRDEYPRTPPKKEGMSKFGGKIFNPKKNERRQDAKKFLLSKSLRCRAGFL
jgi:hypothetical protein